MCALLLKLRTLVVDATNKQEQEQELLNEPLQYALDKTVSSMIQKVKASV